MAEHQIVVNSIYNELYSWMLDSGLQDMIHKNIDVVLSLIKDSVGIVPTEFFVTLLCKLQKEDSYDLKDSKVITIEDYAWIYLMSNYLDSDYNH